MHFQFLATCVSVGNFTSLAKVVNQHSLAVYLMTDFKNYFSDIEEFLKRSLFSKNERSIFKDCMVFLNAFNNRLCIGGYREIILFESLLKNQLNYF